jgi:Uma2 family endonuclease
MQAQPDLPPLEPGDHLDQATFHARYQAMPESLRAELIGGVVYMPSPQKPQHGRRNLRLIVWLDEYEAATPGVEVYENTTAILGEYSEPQPDAFLIVLPTKGGRVRVNKDGYLQGTPELIAETASTTESYDLHSKKDDYERAGVKEYVVVALRQRRVFWFIRRRGKFKPLKPGADGILRSEAFPGLWLDPEAMLRGDRSRLSTVLQQGLSSPEHAAWVARLASR